jgi:hypothetical protein
MYKCLIIGGRVYELTTRVESFKGSTLVSSSFACKYLLSRKWMAVTNILAYHDTSKKSTQ